MLDSRLSLMLADLSGPELTRLEKLIASPYHNTHPLVTQLFQLLLAPLREGEPLPDSQSIFAKIYPGEPYKDAKLRLLFTYLKRLVETFHVLENLTQDQLQFDRQLVFALSRRNLPKHFASALKAAIRRLNKQPLREGVYHYSLLQLQLTKYNSLRARDETVAETLRQLGRQIDLYFVVSKLQQAQRTLSFQRLVKTEMPDSGMEWVLGLIEARKLDQEPAVAVHLAAYNLLIGKDADRNFRKLRAQLQELAIHFHPDEVRSLLLIAVNYCIAQLNAGRSGYLREVFELYRDALVQGALLDQGVLSPFTYKNIASAGLRLEEFSWVEKFLVDYQEKLPDVNRGAIVTYNQARLRFAQKEFGQVVRLLHGFRSKDLFTELDGRLLMIKACYELKEMRLIEYQLQNFRQLLSRKSQLGYHRENYRQFIRFFSRLLNVKPLDSKGRKNLAQEVQEVDRVVDRGWLLEKISLEN